MSSVLSQTMTAEEFFDFTHRPDNRDQTEEIKQLTLLPDFTCKVAEFFRLSGDNP